MDPDGLDSQRVSGYMVLNFIPGLINPLQAPSINHTPPSTISTSPIPKMKALVPFLTLLVLALASHVSFSDTSVAAPNTSSPPVQTTPSGTYCECGYTYCASVLMAMSKYALM